MHDPHVVEAVVGMLRKAELTPLDEVRILAGPACSAVALQQAYEMLTLDTPLYGSRFAVEPAVSECTCPACGALGRSSAGT